jgi:hypothetical protein
MKTIRILATTKLVLAVLFATCVSTGVANAQSVLTGKFSLAEEVRWDGTVLPAGEYTLTIDNLQMPIRAIVRSVDGTKSAMFATAISEDAKGGASYIVVTNNGSERKVRSLNLPQLRLSLTYEPLTKRERTELEVAAAGTVPVVISNR